MRISNKGFLLADSIICLLIVCVLSVLSIMMYQNIKHYNESYTNYIEEENEEYKEVFNVSYCSPRVCGITDNTSDDDSIDIDTDISDDTYLSEQY